MNILLLFLILQIFQLQILLKTMQTILSNSKDNNGQKQTVLSFFRDSLIIGSIGHYQSTFKLLYEQFQMNKLQIGLLLILMMLGHNFVINQIQVLQTPLQNVFDITVTKFNLLYSIPSAVSVFFIIPFGFYYQKIVNKLLLAGAICLSLGQLLVFLFGSQNNSYYFELFLGGRILQGLGAEILYMIQGNMVSSWMGKYAGVVFILPQIGQIINVLATPQTYIKFGIKYSFLIGFIICIVSSIAAVFIFVQVKRRQTTVKTQPQQRPKIRKNSQTILCALSSDKIEKLPDKKQVQKEIGSHTLTSVQVSRKKDNQSRSKVLATNEIGYNYHPEVQKQVKGTQLAQGASEPSHSICNAGKIFWMTIMLCSINEGLFYPFLDNINELITKRFCIPFQQTGYFLLTPFAVAMITSAVCSLIIPQVSRHKLIFYVSFMPLIGHMLIYFNGNCESSPTAAGQTILIFGLIFFGIGIGTYYSVSFPAVGLSVPKDIRGMAYACMAFVQTISISVVPIFGGLIVQSKDNLKQGYKYESILFISICIAGVGVSFLIYWYGNENSFIYNDEEQMENNEINNQIVKQVERQQKTRSRLKTEIHLGN